MKCQGPSWQEAVVQPPEDFSPQNHVLTLQKDKDKELQVNVSENPYLYSRMARWAFPDQTIQGTGPGKQKEWLSCVLALSSPSQQGIYIQATHQGPPQPYLESKLCESQSKAEVLLGSSGTWPENSLRLASVGGQGAKCKLFLSDSVSRKAGHRQNLKKNKTLSSYRW